MSEGPSSNGDQTGRGPDGRFTPGNPGGPGNPDAANARRYRARLLSAVRERDIDLAVRTLRRVMRDGEAKDADKIRAAMELLDRTIGRPAPADVLGRMEALEQTIAELAKDRTR